MTTVHAWGRFTARGAQAVETTMGEITLAVQSALRGILPTGDYRAVVMLGGYGRGEGGVDIDADGREKPHNNLDFLIITRAGVDGRSLKDAADRAIAPLVARFEIGMDVGYVSEAQLASSPCLVMWYDMRFGHKVVLGDTGYVSGLNAFTLDHIAPWDVRNLLVNRGTLLVINELLLEKQLDDERARTVIKHAVKAIIGYGDAVLFFRRQYDWSYVEKQTRMRKLKNVDPMIQGLYDEAAEFRFKPDYKRYLARDLRAWNASLLKKLEPIHRECEANRLGEENLSWSHYLRAGFEHALTHDITSPRDAAKKFVFAARSRGALPRFEGPGAAKAKLGYLSCSPRDRMMLLLPAVAYEGIDIMYRETARKILGAESTQAPSLRRAYLRKWGELGDLNFSSVVKKLGINLEEGSWR